MLICQEISGKKKTKINCTKYQNKASYSQHWQYILQLHSSDIAFTNKWKTTLYLISCLLYFLDKVISCIYINDHVRLQMINIIPLIVNIDMINVIHMSMHKNILPIFRYMIVHQMFNLFVSFYFLYLLKVSNPLSPCTLTRPSKENKSRDTIS